MVAALFIVVTRNLLKMREGRAFIACATTTWRPASPVSIPRRSSIKAFAVSSFIISAAGRAVRLLPRHGDLGRATRSEFVINYFAIIIIGGMGSLLGAVLGAIVWTLLPQVLQTMAEYDRPEDPVLGDLLAKYQAQIVRSILGLLHDPDHDVQARGPERHLDGAYARG